MKKVNDLTDEELLECIDGSTDLRIIRRILKEPNMVNEEGYVDPDAFAESFSELLQNFIGEDEGTDEWAEADGNNWNFGFDIADNINVLILRSTDAAANMDR